MYFADDVRLDGSNMSSCNFVVIDEGYISGVVAFSRTSFKNCEFDNVTFILTQSTAKAFRNNHGDRIKFLGYPLD